MKDKNFKITIHEYDEKLTIEFDNPDPKPTEVYDGFLRLLRCIFSDKIVEDLLK